ncbi:DNA damage tolerance RHC31 [Lecanosticta acicola]|uniref:DNA damage tolerance RHC31 n=1 Tax=Lecanosticta acicola TaxID=111012 RepID=A0AAI8Z5F2_9PEZI|nr:DNA damage tolerance RHC31 [Lecanosticta acicola]
MANPAEAPVQAQPNGINGTNGTAMAPPPVSNGVAQNGETTTTDPGLSADDMALYDRQIRLWGVKAQESIRSAHVLLVSLRALGTEIAKNLTLAGISSLTITDNDPVTKEDLGAQFFLREEDVGKPVRDIVIIWRLLLADMQQRAEAAIPRIQELNPRVTVKDGGSLQDLIVKDSSYFAPFNCVIACDLDLVTLSMINTAARVASRPFYAAGIHGFYGYIFADLVGHEFVVERERSNVPTKLQAESLTRCVVSVTNKKENSGKNIEMVKKQELYCPLLLANSSPLPQDILTNRRKLKAVPALLPCLRALWEFQRTNQLRLPGLQQQDLMVFSQLVNSKVAELQLLPGTVTGDFLKSFVQNIGSEITPTAAFVGGRLSEDVINVLGKREQPIQNFALFDGDAMDGRIYCLFTLAPELTMDYTSVSSVPMDMSTDLSGLNGVGMPIMNADISAVHDGTLPVPDPNQAQGQGETHGAGQETAGQANPG